MIERIKLVAVTSRRPLLALLIAAFAIALVTKTTAAADYRGGDNLTIGATEQVNGDLYTAARNVTVLGRVTGDVVATGENLTISGRVDGAVNALVSDADISGIVGGSVRVVGATVHVSGQISGDIIVASGMLEIERTGSIGGDIIVASGKLRVYGPVTGDIRGNADDIIIDSSVGGDVRIAAKHVSLDSLARLTGDLRYTGPNAADIAPGATVGGVTKQTVSDRFYPGSDVTAWLFSPLFRLLSMLVSGVVLVLLFPAIAAASADGIRRSPLAALLFGVIAIVVAPIVIVLLGVTVVGLPAALIGLVLYTAIFYLSQVFTGLAVGRMLLPKRWDVGERGYNLLAMVIGVVAIAALRQIPAPYVSGIVSGLAAVLAFGGIASAAGYARRRLAIEGGLH